MRRIPAVAVLVLMLAAPFAWAQREPVGERAEEASKQNSEGEGGMALWAWLNFALLTAGLVWMFRKNAVPYFVSRAIGIRKGMLEAEDARAAAERKIAAVEARLANLTADIQALKNEALAGQKSEHERIRRETAAELAKIQLHAEQEIAAAGKAARLELKRYTAELAVGMAERKIRARMNPATQDALVRGFVHNLGREASPAQTN